MFRRVRLSLRLIPTVKVSLYRDRFIVVSFGWGGYMQRKWDSTNLHGA
jgi:hypothetical protein